MSNGGRLANVRLKDSYVRDSLTNAITGMGTLRDPRMANLYAMRGFDPMQVAAAYSSSGLMRKIINIPALDMVREWRTWKASAAQIEKIEAEEKRLQLRQKVRHVEVMRGCGGGAFILGLPGLPSTEAPKDIGVGKLAYINVVNRQHLKFTELQDDATKPGFGEPVMWKIQTARSQVDLHPSRVIPFRGDPPPLTLFSSLDNAFWGESRVAQVIDAVEDCDTARQAFAALVQKARNTRIGIPNLLASVGDPEGEAAFQRRMASFQMAESIFSATVFDSGSGGSDGGGEEIKDAQYNFAGAKDIIMCFAMFASAVSDIPQSRLFGTAPEGMNSSGNSQQRDWNKMVGAKQTLDLSPCLDRIDPYLLGSALGSVDQSIWYQYGSLDQETPAETATRFNTFMDGVTKVQNTATVPDVALTKGVQSWLTDEAILPALEDALEEIPEDERFGQLVDEPNPDDHEPATDPKQPAGKPPLRVVSNDATPRSLYVSRSVLNRDELQKWATAQGLGDLQDDLHVTIVWSRTPIDWMKVDSEDWNQEKDGTILIAPGGVRIVEPLGNKSAVLLFTSSRLSWRHQQVLNAGATSDYPDYQPHVSLTEAPVDLSKVEPYRGVIKLGSEKFEEVDPTKGGGRRDTIRPFDDHNPNHYGAGTGRGGQFAPSGAGGFKKDIVGLTVANAEAIRAATGVDLAGFKRVARSHDLNHAARFSRGGLGETGRIPPSKAVLKAYAAHASSAHTIRLRGGKDNGSGLRIQSEITIGARNYTLVERVGAKRKQLSLVTMYEKR